MTEDRYLVSAGWLETRPNPHAGFRVTDKGQHVEWAQIERPVNYHFGRVFAFDYERDAHAFILRASNTRPPWLPVGAHDLSISPPVKQRRPANDETSRRRYAS